MKNLCSVNAVKNLWRTSSALVLIGCILASDITAAAEQVPPLGVQVDFSKSIGKLKALHGVNSGPRTVGRHSGDLVTLHKEAGFPSVRLHDCNWPHTDVVDAKNEYLTDAVVVIDPKTPILKLHLPPGTVVLLKLQPE